MKRSRGGRFALCTSHPVTHPLTSATHTPPSRGRARSPTPRPPTPQRPAGPPLQLSALFGGRHEGTACLTRQPCALDPRLTAALPRAQDLDSQGLSLYPVAILIDELKNEDVQLRGSTPSGGSLQSQWRSASTARARTEELIPFLKANCGWRSPLEPHEPRQTEHPKYDRTRTPPASRLSRS